MEENELNRKLKCLTAVALALVMIVTAAAVMPASAASRTKVAPGNILLSPGETDGSDDLAPVGETEGTEPVTEPASDDVAPTQGEDPEAVGEVTGLTRTSNERNRITLSWSAVDGVRGYRVYWRDADAEGSEFTLLSTIRTNNLTIRNLKVGCMYEFKVAAFKIIDRKVIEGEACIERAGTTPVGVNDLRVTSGGQQRTKIEWNKNEMCDGYVLYRQANAVWSQVAVIDRDQLYYEDYDVTPGGSYNYRICAYREDVVGKLQSGYSNTLNTVCGLRAPTDKGTNMMLRRVHFKWVANAFADGYEIRYSTDNVNFSVLTDTKSLYYDTDRLTNGVKYYFRLYPYKLVSSNKVRVYGTYTKYQFDIANSAYNQIAPSTYIEVSRDRQHMWYYIDDKLYVSTDVVTGNYNSMDTPAGYWAVNNKASPCTLVGADYVSYVNFWMSFIGGSYGIHDASWRSSFGGTIYKGNGSHGCINTPYDNVKKMYAKVTIGTPVIVY